ncbi:MAG: ribonuclease HII [Hyphomicrobiales bacterium]
MADDENLLYAYLQPGSRFRSGFLARISNSTHRQKRYGPQKGAFNATVADGPDDSFEKQARGLGFGRICGVDEAGRGPLAGPVVAAAVVLPFWDDVSDGLSLPSTLAALNDSKTVPEPIRDALFATLCEVADVSIASVSAQTIDARNIRKASLEAMRLAIAGLPSGASFALVDGRDEPPGLTCAARAIIKGDGRSLSIAAASICAKVARDRMLVMHDRLYPGYGFAQHKGYATQMHRNALADMGPCPIHRMTFAPVRNALMERQK